MVARPSLVVLQEHVAAVRSCRLCPGVEPPPVAAEPLRRAGVLLVGQAPGPREKMSGRLFAYTAGTRLFSWFAEIGVEEEIFRRRVWMSATIRCFPGRAPQGGDRAPDPAEVERCAPFLDREIALLGPDLVLAVGTLAIAQFLGPGQLAERVGRLFAAERAGRTFEVLPLPHPSGRSTWLQRPAHRLQLTRALDLLRGHAAWRRTFA